MKRDRQTYSREDAIEVNTFERLLLGALKIEDDEQRLRTVMIVLCAGRLGLRANEIQHLHEGWINWERGEIRVPAHEPCFCKWCLEAAQGKVETKRKKEKKEEIEKNTGEKINLKEEVDVAIDDPEVLEYAYEHQYEPKPGASARVVPFGWSKRITAYLMRYFDENEYLDLTQQQMRNDVRKAARQANGVDSSNLTLHPLRATGGTFFADAGLLAKPLRDLMGWTELANANRYIRASGRLLTTKVYELFGKGEWAPDLVPENPAEKFPVACDPRPFASEVDVYPPSHGPQARRERAREHEEEPERLYNPRRERRIESIPYNPERHTIPGHVDPKGEGLQEPDVERVPADADLSDWIGHQNEQADQSGEAAARRPGVDSYDGEHDEEGASRAYEPLGASLLGYFSVIDATVEPWATKKWNQYVGFPLLKWIEKTRPRKATFVSSMLICSLGGLSYKLASEGVAIDPVTLEVTGLDKLVFLLFLTVYVTILLVPEEIHQDGNLLPA